MKRPLRRLGHPASQRTIASVVCVVLAGVVLSLSASQGTRSTTPVRNTGTRPVPSHQTSAQSAQTPVPPAGTPAPQSAPGKAAAAAHLNEVVDEFCVKCHFDGNKAVPISLASFNVGKAADQADVAEKMIRKLQAGMMPPPGVARPDPADTAALIKSLETTIDTAAAARPNPGSRTFQRLNRPEYTRAVRDLLGLSVDASAWLPLDTMSANFDNIADEQALSPTLLEGYLNAAAAISRLAVGDREARAIDIAYTNPIYVSQHPWDRVPGAPYGTRGGMVVDHVFPADAEYVFELAFVSGDNTRFEDVDVSINGERVVLMQYENGPAGGADGRGAVPMRTDPVFVRAGQHRVAAVFVRKMEGPYEDLIRPHDWSFAGGGSGGSGITTLPHLRDVIIKGPYRTTGISDTPSRRRVFSCRPTSPEEERPCARTIIGRLGSDAYRRAMTAAEIDRLMPFYEKGAAKGGFEQGVRTALEAILASPFFVFRLETAKETPKPGAAYRVGDLDVASRLSFFLWGAPPDKDLLAGANRGELSDPRGLERHARRMLADPRADALASRFAYQWLRMQDVDKVRPDPNFYPNFDENIAALMRRETMLLFEHLLREDKSMLDLFRADYTFVNERLARHYGFPGIAGDQFRKVTYPDDTRRGLLGHGTVLVQTSFANRTSPVLRGKWVMEVLLGTPPPPAPDEVPALEDTAGTKDGKVLTTRERMEVHRVNPGCRSCHRFMDPIGLALDNFDVTAKWRSREFGQPLDTRGTLYDGTAISTPAQLVTALLKRPVPLVRTFTENLMAYGLGRRVEYFDQPAIRAITKAAAAQDYKMSSLIVGIVTSDAFRLRRADAKPSTDVAQK